MTDSGDEVLSNGMDPDDISAIEKLPHSDDTSLDDLARTRRGYLEMWKTTSEYEEFFETPQEDRPALQASQEHGTQIKLAALLDYIMPLSGPGATRETAYQRYNFEIYFLSMYQKTLVNAHEMMVERVKAAREDKAKPKIQVASPADLAMFKKH